MIDCNKPKEHRLYHATKALCPCIDWYEESLLLGLEESLLHKEVDLSMAYEAEIERVRIFRECKKMV